MHVYDRPLPAPVSGLTVASYLLPQVLGQVLVPRTRTTSHHGQELSVCFVASTAICGPGQRHPHGIFNDEPRRLTRSGNRWASDQKVGANDRKGRFTAYARATSKKRRLS